MRSTTIRRSSASSTMSLWKCVRLSRAASFQLGSSVIQWQRTTAVYTNNVSAASTTRTSVSTKSRPSSARITAMNSSPDSSGVGLIAPFSASAMFAPYPFRTHRRKRVDSQVAVVNAVGTMRELSGPLRSWKIAAARTGSVVGLHSLLGSKYFPIVTNRQIPALVAPSGLR